MPSKKTIYSPQEERANVLTHGFGFILSIPATIVMLAQALSTSGYDHITGALLFGAGLLILYGASTLYHLSRDEHRRQVLRVFDHAAIYVLIAGTYSPVTLITLKEEGGMIIFIIVWSIALAGIAFKIFFAGRFTIVSTLLYLLMGWLIVFKYAEVTRLLSDKALWWIVAGGMFYSFGVVFYLLKKVRYSHSIWHIFVLCGSFCHFMAIWKHIL
jgi:hemolysin III